MRLAISLITLALAATAYAQAQQHDMSQHEQHLAAAESPKLAPDGRQWVSFPEAMKEHTLGNMRDHLRALQDIQAALASADYDRAADVAESHLGLTAMTRHGAHELSKFMPKGMQEAGSAMHRSASKFSLIARDAAASGEIKPAIAALSAVMGACVACHNGYRLQ